MKNNVFFAIFMAVFGLFLISSCSAVVDPVADTKTSGPSVYKKAVRYYPLVIKVPVLAPRFGCEQDLLLEPKVIGWRDSLILIKDTVYSVVYGSELSDVGYEYTGEDPSSLMIPIPSTDTTSSFNPVHDRGDFPGSSRAESKDESEAVTSEPQTPVHYYPYYPSYDRYRNWNEGWWIFFAILALLLLGGIAWLVKKGHEDAMNTRRELKTKALNFLSDREGVMTSKPDGSFEIWVYPPKTDAKTSASKEDQGQA